MSSVLYTPEDLRKLADAKPDPFKPHLMDEMRKALRWSANVIEAANAALAPASTHKEGQNG